MARPHKCRRICQEPEYVLFKPEGVTAPDGVILSLDEFEVIRLVDLEKKTHEQCAVQMEISRTTVTEIYERARFKVADCLVNGKRLTIRGGDYRVCAGEEANCCGGCRSSAQTGEMPDIPKGETTMRIAVTHENGNVFQHFGHTAQFKLYDVEDGKVIASVVVPTLGSGHGALAGFLKTAHADALICGGIGGGAQDALQQAGIQLFGGVQGSCDAAVEAFIKGELNYNPDVHCDHHDHEHGEGHTCGDHGCGSHDCGHHH